MAQTEISTPVISFGSKGGRCVGLTAVPCSYADCLELEGALRLGIALPLASIRYIALLLTRGFDPSLRVCFCSSNSINFGGKGHPATCL